MAGLARAAVVFDRLFHGGLEIAHVRNDLLHRLRVRHSERVDDLARVKRGGIGPAFVVYVCMRETPHNNMRFGRKGRSPCGGVCGGGRLVVLELQEQSEGMQTVRVGLLHHDLLQGGRVARGDDHGHLQ